MTRRWFVLAALTGALLMACGTPGGPASPSASPTPVISPAGGPPTVGGTVTAGPVCPVEQAPPASACAPRPVGGAVIVATDADGREVGRTTSAVDGAYLLTVDATGTLVIHGLSVAGLMGVPTPVTVTLTVPGASAHVDLEYDTGIR